MIDPATGRFKIVQYNYKQVSTIVNLLYQTWLFRYPGTKIITYNIRNELIGHELKKNKTKNEYRIKSRCESTEKPQGNYILKPINQVIANLVHTFEFEK